MLGWFVGDDELRHGEPSKLQEERWTSNPLVCARPRKGKEERRDSTRRKKVLLVCGSSTRLIVVLDVYERTDNCLLTLGRTGQPWTRNGGIPTSFVRDGDVTVPRVGISLVHHDPRSEESRPWREKHRLAVGGVRMHGSGLLRILS